ncbi:hypothetical protein GLAREA_06097 [Glarea lozoyensis ATCC 20868]|uniref:Uncharacterized protein n=1 Tax=Glarea lozoyensis (strain ATCC 20868 / MF5171) TaxID=1116229 RepID=S3D5P4_GLAL2|nr:uncharacterized protein GLAREA_06097 [Glarea lozoyensis ATCC 20868]EPE33085.1 hypothetical protein GLAREA_06097 [Glarea lozoyensis ATCC 20868]
MCLNSRWCVPAQFGYYISGGKAVGGREEVVTSSVKPRVRHGEAGKCELECQSRCRAGAMQKVAVDGERGLEDSRTGWILEDWLDTRGLAGYSRTGWILDWILDVVET